MKFSLHLFGIGFLWSTALNVYKGESFPFQILFGVCDISQTNIFLNGALNVTVRSASLMYK